MSLRYAKEYVVMEVATNTEVTTTTDKEVAGDMLEVSVCMNIQKLEGKDLDNVMIFLQQTELG